ncbi:MAG: hypothetical protein AAGA60_15820 [Cyanobacteria bacterium P01_E01_bin.42]
MTNKQLAAQIRKYVGVGTRSPLCSEEEFQNAIAFLYQQQNQEKHNG